MTVTQCWLLFLELGGVLLEEVEARRERHDGVVLRVLAATPRELGGAVEGVVPAEELLGREAHVLADLLAAGGYGGVHEQRDGAQRAESVGERLLVGLVVSLGGLRGVVPALVLRAAELLGDAERAVRIEGVSRGLEVERRPAAGLDDLGVGLDAGQVRAADVRRAVEAAAREAVEDVRQERGLLERGVDDARVVLDEDLLAGLLVLVSKGLGLNETAFWSRPRLSQWARSCSGV